MARQILKVYKQKNEKSKQPDDMNYTLEITKSFPENFQI